MTGTPPTRLLKTLLPAVVLLGDTIFAFGSLALGYWFRYVSPLERLGINVPNAEFSTYLPLLLLGVAFLIAAYAQLNLYENRLLLRKFQSISLIIKGTTFWLAAYLGLSLVLRFEPPISRLFVVIAYGCVIAVMFLWRSGLHYLLTRPAWREQLRQRVAVLGWNDDARALAAELEAHPTHPYRFCGAVPLPGDQPPEYLLGSFDELEAVLRREQIDVLIAARSDLSRESMIRAVEICERTYVEWKIIPSSFQILLSGLRLQTIGRLPVLGVEELAIDKLFNRVLKRAVDVTGAICGLAVGAPVILVFGILIKRESPTGPIFFRQTRIGAGHRPFTLWKLRSMQPDAAAQDHLQQSTRHGDPRLLRLGAFMRRWNVDEIPQFWNVLCGDMSLVGPRPERPVHVERLSLEIPHYLPRHLVRPGMTGWAQINGLRGDSSIALRIQHDIYYIENWSLWLDLQILGLTFARWKTPAV